MLVIIDYLQLIVGDPRLKGNRQAEISEISRALEADGKGVKCGGDCSFSVKPSS